MIAVDSERAACRWDPIADIVSEPDPTLADKIAENAVAPASASMDGQHAAQHSLRDQIAADEYLEAKATRKKAKGRTSKIVRFGRFVPPGTT